TTTIACPNKRKQQLKAARAKKYVKKSYVFYEQTDYENLVWPSTYVEGSKRTQRRKKAELKKAAQDTRSITTYFASALICFNVVSTSTSTCESSTELYISIEMESVKIESVEIESVEIELVKIELVEVESMKVELVKVESVEIESESIEI
ncbi:4335_t:CDS:2, partial [Racocetra persica]